MSERVVIGQIVGAFGIKGEVKVDPSTSFESRFDKGNDVFLDGKKIRITNCRWHKGRPMLKLEGIDTMSAAEQLQWRYLEAEGDPELDENEFLIDDLIGLKVITESGNVLGEVTAVEEYPAHEVVFIGEIMIPFVEEFILSVDLDEEIMTVRLIEGMLPGEEGA